MARLESKELEKEADTPSQSMSSQTDRTAESPDVDPSEAGINEETSPKDQ